MLLVFRPFRALSDPDRITPVRTVSWTARPGDILTDKADFARRPPVPDTGICSDCCIQSRSLLTSFFNLGPVCAMAGLPIPVSATRGPH